MFNWRLKCLHYEISNLNAIFFVTLHFCFCELILDFIFCLKGIYPLLPGVKSAMEMQAEAERRKHAQILESEGIIFLYCFRFLEILDLLLY
jgi:hypothetical protein